MALSREIVCVGTMDTFNQMINCLKKDELRETLEKVYFNTKLF